MIEAPIPHRGQKICNRLPFDNHKPDSVISTKVDGPLVVPDSQSINLSGDSDGVKLGDTLGWRRSLLAIVDNHRVKGSNIRHLAVQ